MRRYRRQASKKKVQFGPKCVAHGSFEFLANFKDFSNVKGKILTISEKIRKINTTMYTR